MIFASYSNFHKTVREIGFAEAAKQTAALGFDAVELIQSSHFEKTYMKTAADAVANKKILDDCGLGVSCYSLPCDVLRGERDRVLEDVFRHIELAAILGSPYFHHTLVPGLLPQPATPIGDLLSGRLAEMGETIAKRCNALGLICLYEPQGMVVNGVDALVAWVREMRERGCRVGVCGDLGNSLFVDTPPTEIFKALSKDIRHVHVKDYFYGEQPLANAYRSRNGKYIAVAPVGQGVVDFEACFACIPDFDAAVSMENDGPDEEIKRSVAYIKSVWQKVKQA